MILCSLQPVEKDKRIGSYKFFYYEHANEMQTITSPICALHLIAFFPIWVAPCFTYQLGFRYAPRYA